jgi:hypothetical protein
MYSPSSVFVYKIISQAEKTEKRVALYLKLQGHMNSHGWGGKYAVVGEGVHMDSDRDGGQYAVTEKDY